MLLRLLGVLLGAQISLPAHAQDSTAAPDSVRGDSVRDTTPKRATTRTTSTRRARRPPPVWPVPGPEPLPGSILPARRIVAYYGNPLSRRMGILGELAPDSMLARLDAEVRAWEAADSTTPVQPALHLIAVVAQAHPGADGKYRLRMGEAHIERVAEWAERRNALVFLDLQIGLSTLQQELPRLARFLRRPNFHLGLDPEFAMRNGAAPGTRVGRLEARDVNYATQFLAGLVEADSLPPKVLVLHRFTRPMLANSERITLDPRVQVVVHMDGWGSPAAKRATYRAYIWSEPVQFTGFKIFYRNDRRRGSRLMTPAEILRLNPKPVYIQYQ